MSLFVRVFNNFYAHRKTAKLRSILGNDALWIPPRLWSYAAENQPDGDFSKYSAGEIALLIGYPVGDASTMLEALLDSGFMDPGQKIHDWKDHNGYHATYVERAKKAAAARWTGHRQERTGQDRSEALLKDASSNAYSIKRKPTIEEVKLAASKSGFPENEALKFFDYYESNGWKVGRNPMRSWPSALANWQRTWRERAYGPSRSAGTANAKRLGQYDGIGKVK